MHKHTIAVDLDGVLAKYDKWQGIHHFGDPIPGAKEFLEELGKFARIVIYTVRCCAGDATNPSFETRHETPEYLRSLVKMWMEDNNLPFDDIYIGQGKMLYSCVIDDRAISCRPQDRPYDYTKAIQEAKKLCKLVEQECTDVKEVPTSSRRVCQYCSLPVFEPFAYHERGDCHEAMKTIGSELVALANFANDFVTNIGKTYTTLNPCGIDEIYGIVKFLKKKGFIRDEV